MLARPKVLLLTPDDEEAERLDFLISRDVVLTCAHDRAELE